MTLQKKQIEVGQRPASAPEGTDTPAQHQRDLETLGRIEEQRLCWFCSMELLHMRQRQEAGL